MSLSYENLYFFQLLQCKTNWCGRIKMSNSRNSGKLNPTMNAKLLELTRDRRSRVSSSNLAFVVRFNLPPPVVVHFLNYPLKCFANSNQFLHHKNISLLKQFIRANNIFNSCTMMCSTIFCYIFCKFSDMAHAFK